MEFKDLTHVYPEYGYGTDAQGNYYQLVCSPVKGVKQIDRIDWLLSDDDEYVMMESGYWLSPEGIVRTERGVRCKVDEQGRVQIATSTGPRRVYVDDLIKEYFS